MDQPTAFAEMRILLGDAIGLLSDDDKMWAVNRSKIGDDYDGHIAAAEAVTLLGGRAHRGEIVSWTSDGQTVKRSPADWYGWAARLRADSPRSGGTDSDFAFLIV